MALPGVQSVLRDRFSALSRTDLPSGPRVLAIAARSTANNTSDGTVQVASFDPYLATDEAKVKLAFGDGSQAHRAYRELVSGGAARVYIVALPSDTADTGGGLNSLTSTATGNYVDLAFDAAETAQPDIIVPWGRGGHPFDWEIPATPSDDVIFGFSADNSSSTTTSLAVRVANHCADISNRSHPVIGVMGVKPWVGTSTDATESITPANLTTYFNFTNLLSKENPAFGSNGSYLSVVTVEVKPNGYDDSWGYSNGACFYAGAVSQLASWSAPTGKVIFNVAANGLRYNPTRTQQQNLLDKGLMPVALDFNRVPRWVDSATFSLAGSDYTRLTTLRIVFDAVLLVRQISQGFIGESASLQHRNALETAITSGLRGMQQAGALLASDFVVTYFPTQNAASVDLVLTPVFEMRNINVTVSVQL